MKVNYDQRTDTLIVILKDDAQVAESDEDKPGVILDYDDRGDLVSLEILDASQRVTEARKIEFQMAEQPAEPWFKIEVEDVRRDEADQFSASVGS